MCPLVRVRTSVGWTWLTEALHCSQGWVSCFQLCLSACSRDVYSICRPPNQPSPPSLLLRFIWCCTLPRCIPMIPPVRMDPVWGRAQSGPVPLEGRTGLGPRLAVLDWTGLVWTDPCTHIILSLIFSQVLPKTWLLTTFYHHSPPKTDSDRNYTTSVCIFGSIQICFPH